MSAPPFGLWACFSIFVNVADDLWIATAQNWYVFLPVSVEALTLDSK